MNPTIVFNKEEAEIIREKLKQYDVVIGPISDDRMRIAMLYFADASLTDNQD